VRFLVGSPAHGIQIVAATSFKLGVAGHDSTLFFDT